MFSYKMFDAVHYSGKNESLLIDCHHHLLFAFLLRQQQSESLNAGISMWDFGCSITALSVYDHHSPPGKSQIVDSDANDPELEFANFVQNQSFFGELPLLR